MTLASLIDAGSDEFRANAAHMRALNDELAKRRAEAALGGSARARERHVSRGKLLPRDRVTRLLDPGSPFLEIGATAAHGMYDGAAPGAGVIAGADPSWGIRGFAPEAEIHVCKLFPGGQISQLIDALEYCIEKQIDVVNLEVHPFFEQHNPATVAEGTNGSREQMHHDQGPLKKIGIDTRPRPCQHPKVPVIIT